MKFEYRVSLGPSHGSAHVMASRLSAVAAVEFSQHDKGDEDEDEQDDRHSDPNLDKNHSCQYSIHATGFHQVCGYHAGRGSIIKPSSADLSLLVYEQLFVTVMHSEANYIAQSTQFCP